MYCSRRISGGGLRIFEVSRSQAWTSGTTSLHILTLTCPAFDGSMYSNTCFRTLESSLQAENITRETHILERNSVRCTSVAETATLHILHLCYFIALVGGPSPATT